MLFMLLQTMDVPEKNFITDLYVEHYRMVERVVKSILMDSDEVEDLVNDVFIKLLDKKTLLMEMNCNILRAYIVSTARNTAIDFIKKRDIKNKNTFLYDFANPEVVEAQTFERCNIMKDTAIEDIISVVESLSESDRLIFESKFLLDLDDKEMGKILHISPNSVRVYVKRVTDKIKGKIQKEYQRNV